MATMSDSSTSKVRFRAPFPGETDAMQAKTQRPFERSNSWDTSRHSQTKRAAETTDAARARLTALARFLDSAVRIPGTSVRIGADTLLNVIPGVGPLVAKGISSYLIFEARRLGVPTSMLLRMVGNVGIDFAIGAVPVLGWIADAFWRANSRNLDMLNAHLDQRAPQR
jgi:hypothetical protein